MIGLICTYCGTDSSLVREHVIPASYFGVRSYDRDKQWIVEACDTCNTLAGEKVFFSIPDKARFLEERYKKKYKKILSVPYWTPDELLEMSYMMRQGIEEAMLAKSVLGIRIRYLQNVTNLDVDYLRPDWVSEEYEKWLEIIRKEETLTKRKKKRTRGNFGLSRGI